MSSEDLETNVTQAQECALWPLLDNVDLNKTSDDQRLLDHNTKLETVKAYQQTTVINYRIKSRNSKQQVKISIGHLTPIQV